MRIAVAVTNDLVSDQRVMRTCETLQEQSHEVVLIGRLLPNSPQVIRSYATRRMRLLFRKGPLFYAEYNLRLFLLLIFLKIDVVYANDTDTLMGCWWAARIKRTPIVFDAHEIFPEVPELVDRPRIKQIWQRIERRYIPRVDGAITVCQSIADLYKQQLGVEMAVVRNVPHWRKVSVKSPSQPAMLLYQGAVNMGRGIDCMIEAMQHLPQCKLIIAGVGDEYKAMRLRAAGTAWADRIEFLGRLEPEYLHQLTPQASLGLCLLENKGLNYYYSLPNRLGDFVAAGVPILATDFPEIRRVVQTYSVGTLVSTMQSHEIAKAVQQTLDEWQKMSSAQREYRMQRAADDLCWENDKKILMAVIDKIILSKKR